MLLPNESDHHQPTSECLSEERKLIRIGVKFSTAPRVEVPLFYDTDREPPTSFGDVATPSIVTSYVVQIQLITFDGRDTTTERHE